MSSAESNKVKELIEALEFFKDTEKATIQQGFFKTGKGEYAEGDVFWGVTVPTQRKIAKQFQHLTLSDIQFLLSSPIHEQRLTALIILCAQFKTAKNEQQEEIFRFYLANISQINNWDLVDTSCHTIVGGFLFQKNTDILYELAFSDHLWSQRIAIVSTYYFIKKKSFEDTFKLSKTLLNHKHDLIHKAIGWMLREIGKQDFEAEYDFLMAHYKEMPRTALRYAIEHFDEDLRQAFLKGTVS